MNHYPTVLDPILGLLIFMALDFAAPALAIYYSSRIGHWEWMAHIVVVLLLLISPFFLAELTIPKMQQGESPGPGDGLTLLPLFAELVVLACVYVVFFVVKIFWFFQHRIQAANALKEAV
jgi:hypothetical protein